MTEQQAVAFITKLTKYQPKNKTDFLQLCGEALAFAHNSKRTEIAYYLTGIGSQYSDEPDAGPILNMLRDLELPDSSVDGLPDSTDFNEEEHKAFLSFAKVYVNYKWRKLAELVNS